MTIILTAGQGWRYIQKSSPEGLGQQWPHLVNVPVKNTDTERERGGGAVRTVELALHLPLDAIPYVRNSIYDLYIYLHHHH